MYRHVVEAHLTSRQADDAVIWQLADLARKRLRQVHGFRPEDDPARTEELLGPQLAEWMSHDRRHRYTPGAATPRATPSPPSVTSYDGSRPCETRSSVTTPMSRQLSTHEAGELADAVLNRVGAVGDREVGAAAARPRGHPRRRARAARGLPGAGQDPRGALVRAGPRVGVHARPVHARPAAGRPHRLVHLRPARGRVRVPARAAVHRACCWPTRSTGPHPRPRPRCSRRCRSARSPSRDAPSRCRRRSTCSPPPTRSSTRAPTRCPRRSSTGSCCGWPSGTPPPTRSTTSCTAASPAVARRSCSTP